MELIYWPVCSSSLRGWDGVKGVDWEFHFFSHKNIVQHPSNNISILQDRGTYASEKNTLEINNRISRDSEAYLIRLTKYINPRKKDVSLQTEEFYLKDRKFTQKPLQHNLLFS